MAGNTKGVIGILTGGGDVPGLNPAIRAVTIRAIREGYKVIGLRRGWLAHQGIEDIVDGPLGDLDDLIEVLRAKLGDGKKMPAADLLASGAIKAGMMLGT